MAFDDCRLMNFLEAITRTILVAEKARLAGSDTRYGMSHQHQTFSFNLQRKANPRLFVYWEPTLIDNYRFFQPPYRSRVKITWDSLNAFKIYNNIYTNFNCITLLILFENCYKYLLIKNKFFITSLEFIIIKILNPANVYKAAHTNAHWTRQSLDRQCIGLDRNACLLHFLLHYLYLLQFSLLLFYFALTSYY